MTVRKIVLVFAALSIAAVAAAQTDRISGRWGFDGQTLLDLKFDGDATVTGTAYFRQRQGTYTTAIERGSFNPKAGTLKLEGEFTGPQHAMVRYVIEGHVESDTLQVSYAIGSDKGTLTMRRQ
jgi:hypothetical protein